MGRGADGEVGAGAMARKDRARDWRSAAVAGGAIAGVVAAATVAAILVLRWLGPAEPATVAVALGQDWAQVRAASTYRFPFPLTERTRDGYAIQDEQVLFVYSDPTRGFALPTARTVWFRLRNDRVEFIFVLPFREVMRWEEAADLAEETRARVDAAGWRRDHGRPRDAVKAYYGAPSHDNRPARSCSSGARATPSSSYRSTGDANRASGWTRSPTGGRKPTSSR